MIPERSFSLSLISKNGWTAVTLRVRFKEGDLLALVEMRVLVKPLMVVAQGVQECLQSATFCCSCRITLRKTYCSLRNLTC